MSGIAMSTQIRRRLSTLLDVVLRVPPIFIMDSIFVNNMKLPLFYETFSRSLLNNSLDAIGGDQFNKSVFHSLLNDSISHSESSIDEFQTLINNASTFIMVLVFIFSFGLFLLTTNHLIQVYKWFASIFIVIWSYFLNDHYVKYIYSTQSDDTPSIQELPLSHGIFYTFITNYVCQMVLAMAFIYTSGSYKVMVAYIAAFFFILPCLASLSLLVNYAFLTYFPLLMLVISLIYIVVSLILNFQDIVGAMYLQFMWIKSFIRNYGLFVLLETQWARLHVPQVLRVFWLTRLTEQAIFLILKPEQDLVAGGILTNLDRPSALTLTHAFDTQMILANAKYLLVRGCETVIAVLGMTSVLSGISHQIGCMMQSFLVLDDPEDRSIGSVSAILFFILALQNGLTSMEPEKRLMRLYRNFCLLFTAILHFIHNMVSPLLFSLSASRNMSLNRHLRALVVCLFLLAAPYVFLTYLWHHHTLSTWLLAVSAFSIEVIIKVVITLLIYTLFMIDAFRSSMWEQLDDYVYYIRAIGNLIEFFFGIFLFFNGTWILLFESGGTIRALMMCIHAYFNIWCQAIAGLKTFIKRCHAVRKINSLPEASPEQLRLFDDVCAICYQELTNARITKCNHYFHSVCLRKWLYLQDICPLCHKTLYK